MAILLASFSALFYGVADYCGGRATRHATSAAVTVRGQLASVVLIAILLLADWEATPAASDWGWGLLAGLAGGAGLLAFYRAMASGAMTVTAPISAVVGAVVPVVFGFAQGERPGALATIGIAIAVASVALVSSSTSARHLDGGGIWIVFWFDLRALEPHFRRCRNVAATWDAFVFYPHRADRCTCCQEVFGCAAIGTRYNDRIWCSRHFVEWSLLTRHTARHAHHRCGSDCSLSR
jgi:uncharacterized membrane protein